MGEDGANPPELSLRAVLDAVGTIAADLDVDETLQRIVTAAAQLSGARYAALGVLDEGLEHHSAGERRLAAFVTHGMSQEQRAKIGDLPVGHGILGVLIDHPSPLRIDNLGAHDLSAGFPPNHPAMRTFLGTPIRIGSRVFGNLYLTERSGGGPFTDQDTEMVVALAAAAGVVIENARLYAELTRHRRWLEAAAEVSSALLGQRNGDRPADIIARCARSAAGADGAAVLTVPARQSALQVSGLADGPLEDQPDGRAAAEAVLRTGLPVRPGDGGQLMVRMAATDRVAGVLWLWWAPERAAALPLSVVDHAGAFAEQAALALEVTHAQDDRAQLAVFEDRDRIGRDLHDLVIQRLFAVGLALDNTTRLAGSGRVADRIGAAVDQLDETIKDIRRTIFELANPGRPADLRSELQAAVTRMAPSLGFIPQIRITGPERSGVADQIRPHLLAVVLEALSNIGRHAAATAATIDLTIGDEVVLREVVLRIEDNGRGLDSTSPAGAGNGLPNMRARARALNGRCTVGPAPEGGTVVEFRIPAG